MKGWIIMKNELFCYDPACEKITLPEIAALQERLLQKELAYCKKFSPYYSQILKNVDVENFKLSDLKNLPLTEKSLVAEDPERFICVERNISRWLAMEFKPLRTAAAPTLRAPR